MQRSKYRVNWRALLALSLLGLILYFIYRGIRERSIPLLSPPTYQSRVTYPAGPITLQYWRTADDPQALTDILADYKKLHPNVTVNLRSMDTTNYDKSLTEAAKNGSLPDIFSVQNTWLPRYQAYLTPAPKTVFTAQEYRDTFADVALRDLTNGDTINGLTFGISTLGLYYNQDLLAKAGISDPPTTWQDFADDAQKLTVKTGNLMNQPGVALGTPSIPQYVDIISALMMQNGAQMTDSPPTKATFAEPDASNYYPGARALDFYTSFANPNKTVYSWTDGFGSPIEVFERGQLAMMIQYPFRAAEIAKANPKLHFKMAALPQLPGQTGVNYATHWDELVSNKSKNPEIAWDLLRFISSREELNKYSILSNRPASRRDLADKQKTDITLGPFAGQVATARTWYEGNNYNDEGIFTDMINSARGGLDSTVTTRAAQTRITQEIVRSKPPS